jgi:hypothetical protein
MEKDGDEARFWAGRTILLKACKVCSCTSRGIGLEFTCIFPTLIGIDFVRVVIEKSSYRNTLS